jgi:hypothetical protein
MEINKTHVLDCNEYHGHNAPECCDPICWCKNVDEQEWIGTISFEIRTNAKYKETAERYIREDLVRLAQDGKIRIKITKG